MDFKILKIYAFNFKAFNEIDFDCQQKNSIILGGKNGYGKTTLFDIIELAITGEIRRYKDYAKDYTDNRLQKKGEDKPLVHDIQKDYVEVNVEILLDSNVYSFSRIAKTSELKTQIDFSPFSTLTIRKKLNKEWVSIKEDDIDILELKQNFQRYYYIGQEETLSYIKTNEKERPAQLQSLFKTSFFDNRISSINNVIKRINSEKKMTLEIIEKNNAEIEKESQIISSIKTPLDIPYERLVDDTFFIWDSEIELSHLDFNSILSEHGIIKGLLYFAQNQNAYEAYKRNKILDVLNEEIEDISFYIHYKTLKKEIHDFAIFKKNCATPINQLSINTIQTFSFENISFLNDSDKILLTTELNALKIADKALTSSQRLFNQIEQIKKDILLNKDSLTEWNKCPLCGYNYHNSTSLWKSIFENNKDVSDSFNSKDSLVDEINRFKDQLYKLIVIPKFDFFNNLEINDDAVNFFRDKTSEKLMHYDSLIKQCDLKIDSTLPVKEIEKNIFSYFESNYTNLESSIDYSWLDKIYFEAARFIKPEKLNEDKIRRKEQYLQKHWQNQLYTNIRGLKEIGKSLELRQRQNNLLATKLNQAKKRLESVKKSFIEKIIGDIKILFYIYSGRIMQDCFYGRGLFLIYNKDKAYINFTTSPTSRVDALYNLSSGQLIALIYAFTMALNKLYHKYNFMLIDDPVQCIDDINIWGFIETLRHEFQGYSFLFSTHEEQYGLLLRYRLSKFGFNIEYRDLLSEHKGLL